MKSLSYKAFYEYIPNGPLNLTAHINKWKYLIHMLPNKRPYITHNRYTVNGCFNREIQHLKRPIVNLIEMVTFCQMNSSDRE